MKFSKEWLLSNLPDINEDHLAAAMTALGHKLEIHEDYYEIDSPAHRSDCRSVMGIKREICAALAIPFPFVAPTVQGCEDTSIFEILDVDVWDEELCNRLTCRMAFNVRNFTSPHWLQNRLRTCGITPVSCITDIANYVNLELGQPLLILDQRCCTGSLTLRHPFPGESEDETVVLAGDFQPIVMGGTICDEEALLRPDTKSIIICAMHNTESSNDSLSTHTAVQRMCQLIEELKYAIVADGTIDILNFVPHERRISCSMEAINEQCNTGFTEDTLADLLQPIGITIEGGEFLIPSHRSDLISPDELMEEIRRIHSAQKINICS